MSVCLFYISATLALLIVGAAIGDLYLYLFN